MMVYTCVYHKYTRFTCIGGLKLSVSASISRRLSFSLQSSLSSCFLKRNHSFFHPAQFFSDKASVNSIRSNTQAISPDEDEPFQFYEQNEDGYFHNDADLEIYDNPEGEDPDPTHRLGKHLLKYSRVHYRHITQLPTWFTQKQSEIVRHRSPAQIRRCLKHWMVDTNQYEKHKAYAVKPLVWDDDDDGSGGGSGGGHHHYSNTTSYMKIYGPDETVAYAHYFMPSRFSIMCRIFDELKLYLPNFSPERVIDYGCGPGTAGAAIKEVYQENGMKKYSGVDMSRAMIDSAKIMLEDTTSEQSNEGIDCTFWDKIGDLVKRVHNTQDRFDLAVLSFTLSELTTDAARRASIQIMYEMLDINGCLVIVEAGNPHGSHTVRTARQFILDHFNSESKEIKTTPNDILNKTLISNNTEKSSFKTKDHSSKEKDISLVLPFKNYSKNDMNAKIIAPCTHDRPCPLAKGTFCSFSQRVLSGMIRKGAEERYSYVVIQKVLNKELLSKNSNSSQSQNLKSEFTWSSLPSTSNSLTVGNNSKISDHIIQPTPREVLLKFLECDHYSEVEQLMDKYVDEVDWDEYNPPMYRHEWARIIRILRRMLLYRPPLKGKGHITIDSCSSNGLITRLVFSRSNVMNLPSLFVAIRKTTWGGLFPSNVTSSLSQKAKSFSPLTYKTKNLIEGDKHPFSRSVVKDKNKSKVNNKYSDDFDDDFSNEYEDGNDNDDEEEWTSNKQKDKLKNNRSQDNISTGKYKLTSKKKNQNVDINFNDLNSDSPHSLFSTKDHEISYNDDVNSSDNRRNSGLMKTLKLAKKKRDDRIEVEEKESMRKKEEETIETSKKPSSRLGKTLANLKRMRKAQ